MKFNLKRETLLKPLQQIIGAVERRQTIPSLGNILFRTEAKGLSLTATDMEIELVAYTDVDAGESEDFTLPARKLFDICRALPDDAEMKFNIDGEKGVIQSGRSRFSLMTLPAADFPVLDEVQTAASFSLPQGQLKTLLERCAFAMAQQDVRYYLNGLLLEVNAGVLRAVATDGHRLALCELDGAVKVEGDQQVIIPRKGVLELQRLLDDGDAEADVQLSTNHIRVSLPDLRFTSKLIDGRFPDYNRVLPKDSDKRMSVGKDSLRQALARASILSNEKYRGIRLTFDQDTLKIQAHNPEHEEAEEEIEVEFNGDQVEIGFNVNYLLDALGVVDHERIDMELKDANSSALIKSPESRRALYVVMPMRL